MQILSSTIKPKNNKINLKVIKLNFDVFGHNKIKKTNLKVGL